MTSRFVARGQWLLETQPGGTVALVLIPEIGNPAGCVLSPADAAILASALWESAQQLRTCGQRRSTTGGT